MKILVTGATGFIAKSLIPRLEALGHEVSGISGADYDLTEQAEARRVFKDHRPDAVYHLAAKVGGILANRSAPADFIYTNLAINTYFLEEARKAGVRRLIYTFCGCSYPKDAVNPIREDSLFRGLPDENAMFYSLAKGVNHLQLAAYRRQHGLDWVSVVPGNAYGPWDNFSDKNSHVIPGLIRRFHFAKERGDGKMEVWGSGSPIRDFVYVDDVAEALAISLEKHHEETPINVSMGAGVSIKELVGIVKEEVGFEGELYWDTSKPDGHAVKVFDVSRMRGVLGFEPKTGLREGIRKTYEWFRQNLNNVRL